MFLSCVTFLSDGLSLDSRFLGLNSSLVFKKVDTPFMFMLIMVKHRGNSTFSVSNAAGKHFHTETSGDPGGAQPPPGWQQGSGPQLPVCCTTADHPWVWRAAGVCCHQFSVAVNSLFWVMFLSCLMGRAQVHAFPGLTFLGI